MKHRRLFWRIVESIENAIDTGEYPIGSRLPPERELAEKYNVSRPTIREAIIALEVREKVEVKLSSGVYVIDNKNISKEKNIINSFELTQARALIEGEISALAANIITDEELKSLQATLNMMENGEYIEEADKLFHQIIAYSTKNTVLIRSFSTLWSYRTANKAIIDDYAAVCSTDNKKTMAEHSAIYNALVARNAAEARLAMHKHFNRLINALFDAVEARALEEARRENSEKRVLYSIDKLVK